MKKLVYSLLFCYLAIASCSKEQEKSSVVEGNLSPKSTTINLSAEDNQSGSLMLNDESGLKSSAITFSSLVNVGDTIYWQVDPNSYIKTIEDIIIVSTDCEGELFEKGIIFNEDKTQCYGVISPEGIGNTKYDIKYTCKDGSVIVEDPDIQVKPPE